MAKGCKHISCLSITKLADKLEKDGIILSSVVSSPDQPESESPEIWLCVICLHSFSSGSTALAHGRKHNHQIFYKTTQVGRPGCGNFFCAICGKDVEADGLGSKHRSVVEDAEVLIIQALKMSSIEKKTIVCDEDGSEKNVAEECSNVLRPSGLVNLGNTCFLNSALQALAATLLTQTGENASLQELGPIGVSLLGTLRCIPSTVAPGTDCSPVKKKRSSSSGGKKYGNIVDPSPFLGSIGKKYKEFKRLRQQDSHDFLRLLFNALDDEHKASKSTTKAIHQEYFGGKMVSRVVCKVCKNSTEVEEAFLDLSLSIPPMGDDVEGLIRQMRSLSTEDITSDDLSITDLLHFWSRPAELAGENAFACENCPKLDSSCHDDGTEVKESGKYIYRPATLQFWLKELPPCFVIHLQRFAVTGISKRGIRLSKDHTHVAIPHELDLAKYLPGDLKTRPASTRYRLSALVIHEGSSVDSGHYVAVVRYGENDWWHASDTTVRRVSSLANYNPYLVFYTRIP